MNSSACSEGLRATHSSRFMCPNEKDRDYAEG
jgi:hypothetical protein